MAPGVKVLDFEKITRRLCALTGLSADELCDPNALQPNDKRRPKSVATSAGAGAAGVGDAKVATASAAATSAELVAPNEPLVVVLLSGSFNPLHCAHVGVLRLARAELERCGFRGVALGLLAPSSDEYVRGKLGSANTIALHHRNELCRLAVTPIQPPHAPAATAAAAGAGTAGAGATGTPSASAGAAAGAGASAALAPAPAPSAAQAQAKGTGAAASVPAAAAGGVGAAVADASAADADWLDVCRFGIPSASTTCERVCAQIQQRFPGVAHRVFCWELCGADHFLKYSLWRRSAKHMLCVGRPGYMADLSRAMKADGFQPPDPTAFRAALLAHLTAVDDARATGKHLTAAHLAEWMRKLPRLFALVSDGSPELSSTEIRKRLSGATAEQRAADHAWLIANGWMHPAVLRYMEAVGPAKLYLKPPK